MRERAESSPVSGESQALLWLCALPQKLEIIVGLRQYRSGSDLVHDQHAIFLIILDSYGLTRSLPLLVLTRSKRNPDC